MPGLACRACNLQWQTRKNPLGQDNHHHAHAVAEVAEIRGGRSGPGTAPPINVLDFFQWVREHHGRQVSPEGGECVRLALQPGSGEASGRCTAMRCSTG